MSLQLPEALKGYVPTQQQALLASALVSGKYKTQAAAAKAVGLHPTYVSQLLKKEGFAAYLQALRYGETRGLRDNARETAQNGLSLVNAGIAGAQSEDPLVKVQAGGGAIVAASKYAEAFGASEAPTRSPAADDRAAFRLVQAVMLGISIGRSMDGRAERFAAVLDKLRERLQSVECKALSKASVR